MAGAELTRNKLVEKEMSMTGEGLDHVEFHGSHRVFGFYSEHDKKKLQVKKRRLI